MKVLAVVTACFALAAARGSGPYLPSGWKPDGPAFYLPSEVSKPLNNPLKDVVLQESEPSGSDFLREYGPPKVQEVFQDLSHQGLPDEINEKLFAGAVFQTIETAEHVAAEVNEKTSEVNTEVKSSVEEVVAVTESQDVKYVTSVIETESVSATEAETAQENTETSTEANVVFVQAVEELAYVVEPTTVIETTQEVTNEANSEKSIFESTVEQQFPSIIQESELILDAQKETSQQKSDDVSQVEQSASIDAQLVSSDLKTSEQVVQQAEQVTNQEESSQVNQAIAETASDSVQVSSDQKTEESVSQVGETATVEVQQVVSGSQQQSNVVNEQHEITKVESSGATVLQNTEVNFQVVSAVEERIQTVEEEMKKVEEVVQNIPQLIVTLENEIKSQQTETIQAIPAVEDTFGALEQLPEGFLEYGPPGFREYGPPKEDLTDNNIEDRTLEEQEQSIQNNETRKRRFSPKFRSPKKLQ